jgi:hypothetical protein
MANERIPEDPYRFGRDVDYRSSRLDRDGPLDQDYDPGPPPSSGKVALFAVGIAIVLGAIFYALNSTSLTNGPNTPTQSAQSQPTSPRAPPGMHEVTPHAPTSAPGTTTGSAPAQPAIPQATAPENMSRNPPNSNK